MPAHSFIYSVLGTPRIPRSAPVPGEGVLRLGQRGGTPGMCQSPVPGVFDHNSPQEGSWASTGLKQPERGSVPSLAPRGLCDTSAEESWNASTMSPSLHPTGGTQTPAHPHCGTPRLAPPARTDPGIPPGHPPRTQPRDVPTEPQSPRTPPSPWGAASERNHGGDLARRGGGGGWRGGGTFKGALHGGGSGGVPGRRLQPPLSPVPGSEEAPGYFKAMFSPPPRRPPRAARARAGARPGMG